MVVQYSDSASGKALMLKIAADGVTVATLAVESVSADPRGGQPTPVRLAAADGPASKLQTDR